LKGSDFSVGTCDLPAYRSTPACHEGLYLLVRFWEYLRKLMDARNVGPSSQSCGEQGD